MVDVSLLPDVTEDDLRIQPLERSETFPASWYTDPRFHELEREAIFGATSQAVDGINERIAPISIAEMKLYRLIASENARAIAEEDIRYSDVIQREDIRIRESVHKGLASRAYNRGRFSAECESGVHHFQSLLKRTYRESLGK